MSGTVKNVNLEDLLDEDPLIPSQQYALISYILPDPGKNELDRVMFKFRGAYRTIDECKRKADALSRKSEQHYVSINCIETGMWGRLESAEEIANNKDVDVEYKNELMNEMMQGHRDQKDKVDEEFQDRKKFKTQQIKFDGTKEGQKYLNSIKEHMISINDRLERYKSELEEYKQNQEYVEKRLIFNKVMKAKLANLKETDTSFKDSEELRGEIVNSIEEQIKEHNREKAILDKKIEELDILKNEKLEMSLDKQLEVNEHEIKYSEDNKQYCIEKIAQLKKDIEETQNLLEERKLEDLKEKEKPQQSLQDAAKFLAESSIDFSKIELKNPDDYLNSFE